MNQESGLEINRKQMEENARFCAERQISIPTFAQLKDPQTIDASAKERLDGVGLWDFHPANLFRITWKNEPKPSGGGFGAVNSLELPASLTGIKARILGICGKWFPTGAHKVGATFGCLVPALVKGQFDPAKSKAAWPSTGNYCRGGAYVSKLLGCESIAILPEGMSSERFEWLAKVADEVIKTEGCESNVKEIFDMCWHLRKTRPEVFIFNQFEEMGNTAWHYNVTGPAMEEVLTTKMRPADRFSGCVLSSGSGGTLASAYYLKSKFPTSKLATAEALQCATLCYNGFGDHRIEGIGDKHVPWIHDARNTDMAIAVDDEVPMRLMRLFNEPVGHKVMASYGVPQDTIHQLNLMGLSSIGNMVASIKYANYYELTEQDVVMTVFTDSMEMYGSRLNEERANRGEYTAIQAHKDVELLANIGMDHTRELNYYDRKRVHNLKYYTWVEQQGKDVNELNAQWFDHHNYWPKHLNATQELDVLIEEFNDMVSHAR